MIGFASGIMLSESSIVAVIVPVFTFIFGALWGHHGQIKERVKYTDCTKKREACPCIKNLKELESKMKQIERRKKRR